MKRFTVIITALIFMICATVLSPVSVAGKTVTKDTDWFNYKKPKTTYKITTEAQLIGLASLVNEGQTDKWKPTRLENFEGVTFVLTKDIKLTQKWNPIGTGTASYFSGIFDGNGHTISGLKVDSTIGSAGLFGHLTGEVRKLTLTGEVTSHDENSGAFAGQLNPGARVINCTSDVKISGTSKTGGIVGYSDSGVVEGCTNAGDVSGTYKVGGIVGENWGGKIYQCNNMGKISSSKRGVATYGTGGIAGRSVAESASVSECYNSGEIFSYTEATGGVVGYTNAVGTTIESCYNKANITILNEEKEKELTKSWAGGIAGIVGTDGVIITDCYNSGIIRNADVTGGVIGRYITNPFKNIEDRIENNFYAVNHYKYGIGQNREGKGEDVPDSVTGVNVAGIGSALGTAYMNDSSGIYGNPGYPVLRWQQPVDNKNRPYIDAISKDIQNDLDRYLVKTADDTIRGEVIINFFNPDNFMANALSLYNDAAKKNKVNSN